MSKSSKFSVVSIQISLACGTNISVYKNVRKNKQNKAKANKDVNKQRFGQSTWQKLNT